MRYDGRVADLQICGALTVLFPTQSGVRERDSSRIQWWKLLLESELDTTMIAGLLSNQQKVITSDYGSYLTPTSDPDLHFSIASPLVVIFRSRN